MIQTMPSALLITEIELPLPRHDGKVVVDARIVQNMRFLTSNAGMIVLSGTSLADLHARRGNHRKSIRAVGDAGGSNAINSMTRRELLEDTERGGPFLLHPSPLISAAFFSP
jgi:hypothetical protein